jgi:hypothetical protein
MGSRSVSAFGLAGMIRRALAETLQQQFEYVKAITLVPFSG